VHRVVGLAAVALVAAPWVVVARTLTHAKPVHVAGSRPSAIVWGDRVFSSRAQLAGWLTARGGSYRHWSALHPVARSTVEHTARKAFRPPPTRTKAAGPTTAAKRRHAASTRPLQVAATGSTLPWATLVKVALAVLASAMMLVALVPATQLEFREIRPLSLEHRTYLFAAGFSTLAGIAVGLVLA
jgi:hypothetical protein